MITKKLYLSAMYSKEASATVVEVEGSNIFLDQTLFYGEGGGQVGDTGMINDIRIINTTRKINALTKTLIHPDFPVIQVKTSIQHEAEKEIQSLKRGDTVHLTIDWHRRYEVMKLHSATHVVLHFARLLFGKDIPVKGCLIQAEKARLDLTAKLNGAKVQELQSMCNAFIQTDSIIQNVPLENEPEALYWICGEIKMPCGGTHVKKIAEIGSIKLKRRAQGKHLDRLYIQLVKQEQTFA